MTSRVTNIVKYTLLAVVLMIAGAAVFSQTQMFRNTLRSTLYTFLEKEINADIYIGEITGNLVNGFSVDTVMMYIDGAPFVESGRLSVRYNLFDLVNNKITVDSLKVMNPSIHLIRRKNGEWNVSRLSKSTAPKDSAESPLVVSAGRIQIVNGKFHLTDSTGDVNGLSLPDTGLKSINYANMEFSSLEVDLKGMYSARSMLVELDQLSCIAPGNRFILNRLSGVFRHTKERSSLTDLNIFTPSTRLTASVSVERTDAFAISSLSDLRRARVELSVQPSELLMSDLQYFLPSLTFLKGIVRFSGEFEGNTENLTVRRMNASFGTSSVALNGSITNIHSPDEMRLNIVSTQSVVNPSDLPVLMPYYGIPDYASLGPVTIDFQFVGKPLDFLAISTIRSAAGTVTIDGEMVFTEENVHYKGLLSGANVNLEKVFATRELRSRLNSRIFIEGDGFSIDNMKAEATIQIDSSSFRDIPVNTASFAVKAGERIIDGDIVIRSPEGNITAQTTLDLNDRSSVGYAMTANVRDLDLGPVLQDDYYASDISFNIKRKGKGLTLFDNESETNIELLPSAFGEYELDSAEVFVKWLNDSTNGDHLIVRSPIVDGEVKGRFTFNDIVNGVQTHVAGLMKVYRYQRGIVDSSIFEDTTNTFDQIYPLQNSSFAYDLQLKNLRPISALFRFPELDVIGSATGTLYSDTMSTSSTGSYRISTGSYADTNAYIRLNNVSLRYALENLTLQKLISESDPLKINLSYTADEMGVNETIFRLMKLDVDFNKQRGSFSAATDIDTTISTAMEGEIEVSNLENRFMFSRFDANIRDSR
jgi:hypothetical protein